MQPTLITTGNLSAGTHQVFTGRGGMAALGAFAEAAGDGTAIAYDATEAAEEVAANEIGRVEVEAPSGTAASKYEHWERPVRFVRGLRVVISGTNATGQAYHI